MPVVTSGSRRIKASKATRVPSLSVCSKMKFLVLLTGAFLAVSATPLFDSDIEEWTQYKVKYNKEYESADEDEYRMKNFLENKKTIEEHNERYQRGEVTYRLRVNHFADQSKEEISGYVKRYSELRNPISVEVHPESYFETTQNVTIPDELDWRKEGAVTPVIGSGKCPGSGYAFAALGSLEGIQFLKTKKLVPLSVQNIIDCVGPSNACYVGTSEDVFRYIIKNNGVDTEKSYPYIARQKYCKFNPENVGGTCTGYTKIKKGDEEALRQAVAINGPVAAGLLLSHAFIFYGGGVLVTNECPSKHDNYDIGVLVVGYGNDKKSGLDYWLLKNFAGKHWGEDGYLRLARNHDNLCGIASFGIFPTI